MRSHIEGKLVSVMVQYVATSKDRRLECFVEWAKGCGAGTVRGLVDLFGGEELERAWSKVGDLAAIGSAEKDVDKEVQIVLEFLATSPCNCRNQYR